MSTAAELDDDDTVTQLHAIDRQLKRILPRDKVQEKAELLRESPADRRRT